MTKTEFYDKIEEFSDLISFCSEVGCPLCDNLTDDLNETIDNDFPDAHSRWYWQEIRDRLNSIETGYDWYSHDDVLCFNPVDYDFDTYRDDVAEWCEENDIFDPEDDEDDDDDDASDQTEEPEDIDISFVGDFSDLSSEIVERLRRDAEAAEQRRRKAAEKELRKKMDAETEANELSCIEIFQLF